MKIAALIPDRGDRKEFLNNCLYMLRNQSVKLDRILVVDFKPTDEKPDITKRYRIGYKQLSDEGYDLIFFIENDDYYSPTYIQSMLAAWNEAKRPDLFGTSFTTYYHIGLRAYFNFNHPERASMMNTVIKPNLDINWPQDNESFTDMHLWTRDRCLEGSKKVWTPNAQLSIGIKHGVGMCGGRQHTTGLQRFTIKGGLGNESAGGVDDSELKWLYQHVKEESIFNFYKSFKQ